jgi:DNA-binding HxlR family transcriptional regulator
MLTLTLRNLERDGLVVRHYFPEVPPRVDYELTDMGAELLDVLESINSWIWKNIPRIEECRRVYDRRDH